MSCFPESENVAIKFLLYTPCLKVNNFMFSCPTDTQITFPLVITFHCSPESESDFMCIPLISTLLCHPKVKVAHLTKLMCIYVKDVAKVVPRPISFTSVLIPPLQFMFPKSDDCSLPVLYKSLTLKPLNVILRHSLWMLNRVGHKWTNSIQSKFAEILQKKRLHS